MAKKNKNLPENNTAGTTTLAVAKEENLSSEFKFYKNVQRPHEKYYFNEATKEVKNDKGKIVGTGSVLNKLVLVIKFNPSLI